MDVPRSSSRVEHRDGQVSLDRKRDEERTDASTSSARPASLAGQMLPRSLSSKPVLAAKALAHEDAKPSSSSNEEPSKVSFGPVVLPHDLKLPENASLIPVTPKGDRLRAFQLTYDPELDKDKSNSKGKTKVKVELRTHTPSDPRDGAKPRKARREVRMLEWKWHANSTRPKPPPPPRALVISGLSAMTTVAGVRHHFREFGRIEELDLKLDEVGMSTGVAFVSFEHDFGEDLKLHPDAQLATAQRGDLAAIKAKEKMDGSRIAQHTIQVSLDDLERTKYRATYRELLQKRVDAVKAKVAAAKEQQASLPVPLGIGGVRMPPPEAPRSKETSNGHARSSMSARDSSPHATTPQRPHKYDDRSHKYDDRSRSHRADDTYSRRSDSRDDARYSDSRDDSRRSHTRDGDDHVRRRESYDNERTRYRESRDGSYASERDAYFASSKSARRDAPRDERESTRVINSHLAENGYEYIFVARKRSSTMDVASLKEHFRSFAISWIRTDAMGWYVAFDGRDDARRARNVLDGKPINGFKCFLDVREPMSTDRATRGRSQRSPTEHAVAEPAVPRKTHWTDEELLRDSRILLMSELGSMFMRDIRTRVLNRVLNEFLQPGMPGGALLRAPVPKAEQFDDIELDLDAERPKTFNRAAKEEKRRRMLALQEEATRREREAQAELEEEEEEEEAAAAIKPAAAAKKSVKKTIKTKKAEAAAAAATAAASEFEATLQEDDSAVQSVKVAPKAAPTKKAPRPPQPPSPPPDPFEAGLAEDEEDLYFCRIALEKMQMGESVTELPGDAVPPEAGDETDEMQLPVHSSGSARTEGYYRIAPAEKGRHMADRNLGSTDVNASVAAAGNIGLASARDNRADSRRFVQGIEQHKKETATDTDILKFNQLRSRKKQLKFAKSPIHDWGLYAMELIPPGDMVIEYVGEIVRQQVADEREKMYERQGNFSTYLFRVDDDVVVDATKKGNIARLMNHCCTPNCNAKILTLNGEKRIVLFAKVAILPGQELTYDYKFQATGDEDDAIACLCGSPGCRRFL